MTTNRIIMTNSVPLRISRPGYDVTTASGVDQIAFDSSWISMSQIKYEGVAAANSGVYIDYYKGSNFGGRYYLLASFASLGFVPQVLIFTAGTMFSPLTANSLKSRFMLVTHTGVYIGRPSLLDGGTQTEEVPSGDFHYIVTTLKVSE